MLPRLQDCLVSSVQGCNRENDIDVNNGIYKSSIIKINASPFTI